MMYQTPWLLLTGVLLLAVSGCDWAWPLDGLNDPWRCDPACSPTKRCVHGQCFASDAGTTPESRTDSSADGLPDLSESADSASGFCGDGTKNGEEECDGEDFGGVTCKEHGHIAGQLSCVGCLINASGCNDCGDNQIDKDQLEECDYLNLDGKTCADMGFDGGWLDCDQTCAFNTTGCYRCGDGTRNGEEQCDGDDLAGASCTDMGFDTGTIACTDNCRLALDGCTFVNCGDAAQDGNEHCDGADFAGKTCLSEGFDVYGDLACTNNCMLDTSGCCSAPEPPSGLKPSLIVSADVGNDGADGLCVPFRRITAALAVAAPGDVVWVTPGTYDQAHGESFPINVPSGVTLVGDVPNRGAGTLPTLIVGISAKLFHTKLSREYWVTVDLSADAAIKGFTINVGNSAVTGAFGVHFYNGVQLLSIDGSYELQARTSAWRDEPRELAVGVT